MVGSNLSGFFFVRRPMLFIATKLRYGNVTFSDMFFFVFFYVYITDSRTSVPFVALPGIVLNYV